ncbi:MAG: DUF2007 domain-containing protein [Anaerolineae bacterium]|nr:DUF2007 domain-containing protein [Anaerolineae bacterium]
MQESQEVKLSEIYVEQGLLRANVIKAMLEDAGIPVLLKYESIGPVIGVTVDGVGEVHILVPSEHAELARSLINEGAETP